MIPWYSVLVAMLIEAALLIPVVWTIGHETSCKSCSYANDEEDNA